MESTDLAERSRQVMDLFNDGVKKDAFWDSATRFHTNTTLQ